MSLHFCPRIQQQPWIQLNPFPRDLTDLFVRSWLLDEGSLTKRLKQLPGCFSVDVIRTEYGRPFLSEANALGISCRQQVYIREVRLCVDQRPLVHARSIIPRSSLKGSERQLLTLNNKPLGEYLFSHRNLTLGPIEVKQGYVNGQKLWGRRRAFILQNKPILVSEFFLPGIQDYS